MKLLSVEFGDEGFRLWESDDGDVLLLGEFLLVTDAVDVVDAELHPHLHDVSSLPVRGRLRVQLVEVERFGSVEEFDFVVSIVNDRITKFDGCSGE